jgi:hypothetical protein
VPEEPIVSITDLMPDHDQLFDSAWLKWGQGVVHTQTLEMEVDAFAATARDHPVATFRTEYIPKRHGVALVTDSILNPVPAKWGLLLGDIANNYRSCLDHLAWALVRRGRTPPDTLTKKKQGGIYFPINSLKTQFNGELANKLPGVRRSDIAIVRKHQPYHKHTAKGLHSLMILSSVNNDNKHRSVQPVWNVPEFTSIEITNQHDCVFSDRRSHAKRLPLKVGTELVLIPVRKTGPNPTIEVNPDVLVRPILDQNVWLHDWLRTATLFLFMLLAEFSFPPDELFGVGIDWSTLNLDPDIS